MSRRFLPNIEQIKRASEELPDPMTHREDQCVVSVKSGKAERELQFKRIKFASGKGQNVYRWVYEGKVMIRNSSETKRDKKKDDETLIFSLSVR